MLVYIHPSRTASSASTITPHNLGHCEAATIAPLCQAASGDALGAIPGFCFTWSAKCRVIISGRDMVRPGPWRGRNRSGIDAENVFMACKVWPVDAGELINGVLSGGDEMRAIFRARRGKRFSNLANAERTITNQLAHVGAASPHIRHGDGEIELSWPLVPWACSHEPRAACFRCKGHTAH